MTQRDFINGMLGSQVYVIKDTALQELPKKVKKKTLQEWLIEKVKKIDNTPEEIERVMKEFEEKVEKSII